MPGLRRQVSLYLSEPERARVDEVRSRLDPRQHRMIPAHVTLCREDEFDDPREMAQALVSLGPIRIELELGPPARLSDGCVLLPVQGPTDSFDRLRARLLGGDPRRLRPHVTLLHPRHAAGKEASIQRVDLRDLPTRITLREVALIEQVDGGPWRVLATNGP